MTEHVLHLPDRRILSYALYGPTDGWPVMYFHGTPSSRLEITLLSEYGIEVEKLLSHLHLQLIAVDRTGMGLSTYNPNAGFLSFASDVHFLMDYLKIMAASAFCWSGGGPFALALAWKYPDRIKNVFILCGFSRQFTANVLAEMKLNRWYFLAAKHLPLVLKGGMNVLRRNTATIKVPRWLTGLPPVDYELIKYPAKLQMLARLTLKEACRQGANGPVQEARLYFKDLGFSISELLQPVHFWWGTEDRSVTKMHAQAVEKEIKNSIMHYTKGEGHLSVYIRYFEEALQAIASLKDAE